MSKTDTKMVLLNGPAGCGKGIVVNALEGIVEVSSCKDHLIELTAKFFNLSMEVFNHYYLNRDLKETPQEVFAVKFREYLEIKSYLAKPTSEEDLAINGLFKLSAREALIYVSEVVCKPAFGDRYFGKVRASRLESDRNYIDDSCGFVEEIYPLFDVLDQDAILLIRVKGRGDYSGDSRSYIPNGVVKNTIDVENISTEEEYVNTMVKIITEFLLTLKKD